MIVQYYMSICSVDHVGNTVFLSAEHKYRHYYKTARNAVQIICRAPPNWSRGDRGYLLQGLFVKFRLKTNSQ
jgi:hypothetical protein